MGVLVVGRWTQPHPRCPVEDCDKGRGRSRGGVRVWGPLPLALAGGGGVVRWYPPVGAVSLQGCGRVTRLLRGSMWGRLGRPAVEMLAGVWGGTSVCVEYGGEAPEPSQGSVVRVGGRSGLCARGGLSLAPDACPMPRLSTSWACVCSNRAVCVWGLARRAGCARVRALRCSGVIPRSLGGRCQYFVRHPWVVGSGRVVGRGMPMC